ncbi:MAG: hypothetical protein ACYTKD_21015 [Planctomycetota bacterium]|jgi:hypothetical protein
MACEYAKLFFDEDDWKIHREWPEIPTFTGKWKNDIEALNALSKQGWELVASYQGSGPEDPTSSSPEHMLRRAAEHKQ